MVVNMTTAVSLFAGVGGFDLALERAGVKVVATVEWDKHAQKVLQRRFPNAALFGDIQGVTGEQLRAAGFDPSNGIITGGFPCQDLSVAGKRAGLAGTRSGLFWEICRLLDETRTQTFILENVPGLLSSNNGRDMAVVIEALVERGYRIAWRVLDAQYFGVPQRRRRVFIVGCLGESGKNPAEILAIGRTRERFIGENDATKSSTFDEISPFIKCDNRWTLFSKVRRSQNINDWETWTERNFTNTLNLFDNAGPVRATELLIDNQLFEKSCLECGDDDATENHPFCLDCLENNSYQKWNFLRRLTPTECERLQGFPDGWTDGQADSHRYKQIGNAVAVPVVQWIIDRLVN